MATEQDAMGLTSSLPMANGPRATLIVCPLSVLSNWLGDAS
jgi:SWI/SNF-related matrix-associated actin-dependent regulator of chromatin subfamily A3